MSGSEGLRVLKPPAETNAGEIIDFPIPTPEQADLAVEYIVRQIPEVYLALRGVERAIFVAPENVNHRENDAEHSWHLENIVRMLHACGEELGLHFSPDFSIALAATYAHIHDTPEGRAGDEPSTRSSRARQIAKRQRELEAAHWYAERPQYKWMADAWYGYEGIADPNDEVQWITYVAESGDENLPIIREETEMKRSPEALFVNDLDKMVGTLNIFVKNGERWKQWDGESFSFAEMCHDQRKKIRTPQGHVLFDAIERLLEQHPECFPDVAVVKSKLFPDDIYRTRPS